MLRTFLQDLSKLMALCSIGLRLYVHYLSILSNINITMVHIECELFLNLSDIFFLIQIKTFQAYILNVLLLCLQKTGTLCKIVMKIFSNLNLSKIQRFWQRNEILYPNPWIFENIFTFRILLEFRNLLHVKSMLSQ